MLPAVATGEHVAGRIIMYSWAMVAASLALWPVAHMTVFYAVAASVLAAIFLRAAYALRARVRRADPARPMLLFHWSITYLSLLFVCVGADALLHNR